MNNQITPLLSIVIATKNRVPYCINAIETILALDQNNFELVVQDNTDNLELKEYIESHISDMRLVYNYTPPPFSSIANFNAALELATGEYVCMIGDDDGINPEIFEATLWAKNNNVDSLVGGIPAQYLWSGTGVSDTLFTKISGGSLSIASFTGKAFIPKIEESLLDLMKNGCTNYLDFSLPKFYHGIVRRECMEMIKNKTGAYIKGLSPDIYSAISLACVVNKLVTIDYPLTIPGASVTSSSITEGQIKKHSKKLEDAPHFRDRGSYTWSTEVPRIYCAQTIWADSGFAALREIGRLDLIKHFNKFKLYANIIWSDPSNKKTVFDHMITERGGINSNLFMDFIRLFFSILSGPCRKFLFERSLNRLMMLIGRRKFEKIDNVQDINAAMTALVNHLNSFDIKISDELSKASR
jgi:glycosyltransferase involved in cell wall biosynthesis